MSADTEFEAWVRSELATIAAPVTPRPDPYGRLLRRRRTAWFRRGVVASVAALAAGAAATILALSPAGTPPAPEPHDELGWVEALVDGPPRGALAADGALRRDLEEAVRSIVRTGDYHKDLVAIDGHMHSEQEVRLLFADDIDDRRIAVLALQLAEAPPDGPFVTGPGRTRILWLLGPRGSSAGDLASALTANPTGDVDSGSVYAAPLTIVGAGEPARGDPVGLPGAGPARITWVGLSPPGCTMLAAPAADATAFTAEPTGSYIVRTPETHRSEYWRVSCGGVVREERPVPWSRFGVSSSELAAKALADLATAGLTDDALRIETELSVRAFASSLGPFLAGPPRVRYAGNPPGILADETDVDTAVISSGAVVLVAPTTRATWMCHFVVVSRYDDGSSGGEITMVNASADPLADGATVAATVANGTAPPQVFAALTPAAVTVQLLAADNTVLATSAAANGFAILTVPERYLTTGVTGTPTAIEGLRVFAYNANGSLVSTTPVLSQVVDPLLEVHRATVAWD